MKQQDHIFWGAFLHDIGKLFERGDLLSAKRKDDFWKAEFCPRNQQHGYYTHLHVLNSDEFNEYLSNWIGNILPTRERDTTSAIGALNHWMNYSAKHHAPSSVHEKLVALADRLASTEREPGRFYTHGINKKAQLEPITARVTLDADTGSNKAYRVKPVCLEFTKDVLNPNDISEQQEVNTKAQLDEFYKEKPFSDLTHYYQDLGNNLMEETEKLVSSFTTQQKMPRYALAQTLLTLFEKYLSHVPAATNTIHPDISLYDHLKITGAIAETLQIYNESCQSWQEGDNPDRTELDRLKNIETHEQALEQLPAYWRLVCCDFSGIQKFIYGIISKGAAKALRGRSLYVQLLCDVVSDYLLRQLDLYPASKIYSSGGKFYLLIAATQEQAVQELIDTVNDWLFENFYGEIHLACGITHVTAWHFQEGNMGQCWHEVNKRLYENKEQKYKNAIANGNFFEVKEVSDSSICNVTGMEINNPITYRDKNDDNEDEEYKISQIAYDLMELGRNIKKADYFLWDWHNQYKGRCVCKLSFKTWGPNLYLVQDHHIQALSQADDLTGCILETLNNFELPAVPCPVGIRVRQIGRWDEEKTSCDWTFDDFASKSTGIERLGVLRMDVDNLGEIFTRGLRSLNKDATERPLGSLSRMTALSRQLNYFFSGYLNKLLEAHQRTQIIYSGGDDLFIIGSWDELIPAAHTIKEAFATFTCYNRSFSISGGLATIRGKYPINKGAVLAGEMEEQAKHFKRPGTSKNAFAVFNTAVGWESWDQLQDIKSKLEEFYEETHSNALLYRLRELLSAIDAFKQVHDKKPQSSQDLESAIYWQKYRWRLIYNLARVKQRYQKHHPEQVSTIEALQEQLFDESQGILNWLTIPVCWQAYEQRVKE